MRRPWRRCDTVDGAAAGDETAAREVEAMVLSLLVPVAFLLFMLTMERVEARLFPTATTAHLGEGEVGPPVSSPSDDGARD